jgi:hypothetical protein
LHHLHLQLLLLPQWFLLQDSLLRRCQLNYVLSNCACVCMLKNAVDSSGAPAAHVCMQQLLLTEFGMCLVVTRAGCPSCWLPRWCLACAVVPSTVWLECWVCAVQWAL